MRVEEMSFSEWDAALPDEGFELFHTTDALEVLESHWAGELRLFGGFKGQEPIGLLPVFIRHHRLGRIVSSPPVGFGIGRLGPIVMSTSPKQRKREAVNKKFVRNVIETIDATDQFTLFRMVGNTTYNDPRPFKWNGFDTTPEFTYQIDFESKTADQVLKSFSRDLRKDIRNRDEVGVSIRRQMDGDAKKIYKAMVSRYRKQGKNQPVSWEFVEDLLAAVGDGARVYVAESDDGEFLSGMIMLYADDTAYNWKGGTKPADFNTSVSVNNLLHWKIIADIIEDSELDSITKYDFYTANNERLSRYKSSFNGSLVPYYTIESNGVPMAIAKKAYRTAMSTTIPHGKQLVIGNTLKNK